MIFHQSAKKDNTFLYLQMFQLEKLCFSWYINTFLFTVGRN